MPVLAGEGFTPDERASIDKAIRHAETESRYEFSVYVGPAEGDPRAYAEALHARLAAPSRSVLVMVDPAARALEVVTGGDARRDLEDHEVGLAVVAMQSEFLHGDLGTGLVRGIHMLAAYARKPPMLHVDD